MTRSAGSKDSFDSENNLVGRLKFSSEFTNFDMSDRLIFRLGAFINANSRILHLKPLGNNYVIFYS